MDKPSDKLDSLFAFQENLNQRIGVVTRGMSTQQRTEWIQRYCLALQQEIAELIDSTPWKWWANYQEFDLQNARVEVVDMFHFLISLTQVLNMSADDVYDLYLKKNKINHDRQKSGYNQKDEADNEKL